MSTHIAVTELGLDVEIVRVDLTTHKTESGEDYYEINSRGYVPMLAIDEAGSLTEASAILQYLADLKPEQGMIPEAGTFERNKMQELLTFISTELHKGIGAFFVPDIFTEGGKGGVIARLQTRFAYLETLLGDGEFIFGDTFTVADAYLFTVMNWRHHFNIDISEHAKLSTYLDRLASRESIQKTMKEEGLIS